MTRTAAPQAPSAFAPLARPLFLALFLATAVSNVGAWMQDVGRAWLMTELTPSPVLVALVQGAAMAALAVFTLPAGVAADALDRRRILLWAQAWMLAASGLLGALALAGAMTPDLLLLLTFLSAAGAAFVTPAFQAALPEIVGEDDLPQAVMLNGISFNVARAVGPAIGGAAVAAFGAGAVFLLNALTFAGVLAVLLAWRPKPAAPSAAPRERALEALAAGLRYARSAPAMRGVLLRTLAFALPASALFALLPLVARAQPQAGPDAYGLLLAGLGAGSIAAGLVLPRLERRIGARHLLVGAACALAVGLLAAPLDPALALAAMVVAGVGWMISMASLMVGAQVAAPGWVRGRAVSIFMLVFAGAMAVGAPLWGALAGAIGLAGALAAAAALLVAGAVATRSAPLATARDASADVVGATWPAPAVAGEPGIARGPVHITIEYRVAPGRESEFLGLMDEIAATRRATGTLSWRLWAHGAEPGRWLETNLVGSWGEHLRQRARQTAETRDLEARVHATLDPQTPFVVTHWFAEDERHLPPAPTENTPH